MSCDMPEFFDVTYPHARNTHTCCSCNHKLTIGEKYANISGIWTGKFDHYKMCMTCFDLYNEHNADCYDGLAFDELWEYLRESDIAQLLEVKP